MSFRDVGLKYTLDPFDEPVIRTEPGETIILEVEDACSAQIGRKGDRMDRSKIPYGNPVLGPIYIENVERGSTVTVSIEWIKPTTGQGVTYFSEFNEGYIVNPP